ncbi:MAG: hypothetical protein HY721_13055 [Planctomycetes bacterium]|nr:hypothetical protein [Planctomycetota bacterium]
MVRYRATVILCALGCSSLSACACPAGGPGRVARLGAAVRAVGPEGRGHPEAQAAVRELSALEPEALPELLAAMDGAGPVALNWLRGAADSVAERALRGGRPLPGAALEAFVLERRHAPRARRLAYELLAKADPSAPERLVPGMLDDPSVELRRDAVEREMALAEKALEAAGKEAGLAAFRRVLAAARDPGQVDRLAKKLESLGEKPDLRRHYGFVRRWRVVGPFDNAGQAGFAASYSPEEAVDFASEHAGKIGPVRWVEHQTEDPSGVVDLNALLGKAKGVLAYAACEVESPAEREVHIRSGTPNAIKIWLNGRLLFQRDEYHHGMSMDQYVVPAVLRPGKNLILLKVCQNEQTEDWTESWTFQLRVCDPTGGGIL